MSCFSCDGCSDPLVIEPGLSTSERVDTKQEEKEPACRARELEPPDKEPLDQLIEVAAADVSESTDKSGGKRKVGFGAGADGDAATPKKADAPSADLSKSKKGLHFAEVEVETVAIAEKETARDVAPPSGRLSRCTTMRSAVPPPEEEDEEAEADEKGSARLSVMTTLPDTLDPHRGLRRKESVATVAGPVHEHYEQDEKLGEGGFGTIVLVRRHETAAEYAMKIIEHHKVADDERFELELTIFRKLQHPHIVKLNESFKDSKCYYLVMELCTGGDLFDRIANSYDQNGPLGVVGLPPNLIARYMWQMLSGIAYLHHYRFAHRDIKPENYMLATTAPDAPLKLIDFGLARAFQTTVPMTTCVGSAYYMAPEVLLRKGYDEKCDIWSVGACAYTAAVGSPPFPGKTEKAIFEAILKAELDFVTNVQWDRHPQEMKDLLQLLMKRQPADRPAAKKVIASSEWLKTQSTAAISEEGCCAVL